VNERDRCRGALLGLAVGDALGAPLEGADPDTAARAVARGLEMSGGGRWAPGEWTDDTALALALAESIVEQGLLDAEDLAQRYIQWAKVDGKGIGRTTRGALVDARGAEDARVRARRHYARMRFAAGNGTVMRATPIALAARTLAEAVEVARRDAELTHADPIAGVTSAALCAALLAIRAEADPLAAASAQAVDHPRLGHALAAVRAGEHAELATLAAGPEAGACWTTLAVALYALTTFDDYEAGVSWTIGLGGDVDTNAAVTGALFGCRHGQRAIPNRWLATLHDHERITRAADGLAADQRGDRLPGPFSAR
jgi:ADP-ribosyl-[dinitrogen reductase] hydrolase